MFIGEVASDLLDKRAKGDDGLDHFCGSHASSVTAPGSGGYVLGGVNLLRRSTKQHCRHEAALTEPLSSSNTAGGSVSDRTTPPWTWAQGLPHRENRLWFGS